MTLVTTEPYEQQVTPILTKKPYEYRDVPI